MGNKERPTGADSYIDALNVTCAWLAVEIRCAMYNLKRDAAIPDEICRSVGCKAVVSSTPRPGKEHLAEAAVRAGEPVCDRRKQNKRILSDTEPVFPKTPGKAKKKPKDVPKVAKETPQEPPKEVPEQLEESPQAAPKQDTSTATPNTSGPWINPFPQKRPLIISAPEPAETSPSPDTNQGQTISNDQLWPATQPPREME